MLFCSDHGLMNATVTGDDGLTVDIEIVPARDPIANHVFQVTKVTSVIDNLDVEIVMAEHEYPP